MEHGSGQVQGKQVQSTCSEPGWRGSLYVISHLTLWGKWSNAYLRVSQREVQRGELSCLLAGRAGTGLKVLLTRAVQGVRQRPGVGGRPRSSGEGAEGPRPGEAGWGLL